MNRIFNIRPQYFDLIQNGKKTIEGRIATKEILSLKVGENIVFLSEEKEPMKCVVKSLRVYHSFELMIEKEGIEKVLPGIKTIEEGVALYRSFPNYEEREKMFGVVAIEIEVI
jgi:ASC-1-like (ASCH) protein